MKYLTNHHTLSAFAASILMLALALASFLMFEPTVGHAQSSDDVTITQQITAELSVAVASSSITMDGTIAGLTGGIANGETDVIVTTNNSTGYNMTIQFSSSTAMDRIGGGVGRDGIRNYVATSTADLAFDSTQVYAQFGYSVHSATDAGDIDLTFLDDTSACGTGSNATDGNCWLAPSSTAAELIVNRSSATLASGATTTVQFRVDVPSTPVPAVPTGFYTATATLTTTLN